MLLPAPPTHVAPLGQRPPCERAHPHLVVSADEEGLDFDAVADCGHGGAGGDGSGMAGGGGDEGVGHTGAAQRRGDGGRLGQGLRLAAGRWHMAHGVVGGGEGWAGVLDADHGGLLQRWGLLGWPVPAWGDGEAVWNQSLWPNLGEGQLHGQADTQQMRTGTANRQPGQSQDAGGRSTAPTDLAQRLG